VLTRGKAAIAAAGLVATGGLAIGAQASGQPTGGVVHLYEYDPPTAVPGRIILTGAIFDHGLDHAGRTTPTTNWHWPRAHLS
jgi:hypothetical protein